MRAKPEEREHGEPADVEAAKRPATRLGAPEELASMVVELLTNDYMNGETVRVDGGIRMPPK